MLLWMSCCNNPNEAVAEHSYGDKDALTALNVEWKDVVEQTVIIIMVVIISCNFLNYLSGNV